MKKLSKTKKCTKCGKVLAYIRFSKNKSTGDGYHCWCKECQKKYYQENREKERERRKKYYQENKEEIAEKDKKRSQTPRSKFSEYKSRAKSKGISFFLSFKTREEKFKAFMTFWQKPCAYCKSKIETVRIDRRDNTKGYTLENGVSCCWPCNSVKGDFETDRIKAIFKGIDPIVAMRDHILKMAKNIKKWPLSFYQKSF